MNETTDPYVWVVRHGATDISRHLQMCAHFEASSRPVVATSQEVATLPVCKSCTAFLAANEGETMGQATERLASWWWQRRSAS